MHDELERPVIDPAAQSIVKTHVNGADLDDQGMHGASVRAAKPGATLSASAPDAVKTVRAVELNVRELADDPLRPRAERQSDRSVTG